MPVALRRLAHLLAGPCTSRGPLDLLPATSTASRCCRRRSDSLQLAHAPRCPPNRGSGLPEGLKRPSRTLALPASSTRRLLSHETCSRGSGSLGPPSPCRRLPALLPHPALCPRRRLRPRLHHVLFILYVNAASLLASLADASTRVRAGRRRRRRRRHRLRIQLLLLHPPLAAT